MRTTLVILLVALGIAALAGLNSFYTVRQDQQALVLQFGNPVAVRNEYQLSESGEEIDEAGLFFKLPWEEVIKLDRKNIGSNIANIEVLASDQRRLTVDAFVRWRIVDPLTFYQRFRTERNAVGQIQRFTETNIRNALGQVPVPEIISGQRVALMNEIRLNVNQALNGTGIDIIDVRIRQADLPVAVAEGIYERMRSEREQEAQRIRSEGDEQALLIEAQANREQTVIRAEANQQSEEIRGAGDAEANRIYAEAYGRDIGFFRLQRGLIACERAIQEGTVVVVDSEELDICRVFIEGARAASGR
ncbi:protease modulator HflC [Ponticaulis sp.]|uniref:protease modulator HflC n=1 Tax=Ponticaulis sp. TaxID=2020902 RepID=UPI000B6A93B4|nr:protease modulator HflC [Ponticaulis sp.]MAI91385.1 protease modulator HflC [Ponticaulis sp.]OUX97750.1 MAG: protease modulator HflC [Hyphomonadaceae bacterium TMED5]|tara:strand:- start:6338 stop:7249 length:912 start_codon:yes stop_codon:yes gene_type:complete